MIICLLSYGHESLNQDCKKIEQKYQEGKVRFRINRRYSIDIAEGIQHQTRNKSRQRPIKREPPIPICDSSDSSS
eukprot:jgi/Bigna1/64661/fgenesh1_kg.81_\